MTDVLKALAKAMREHLAVRGFGIIDGPVAELLAAVEAHECTTDANWTVENEAKMSAIHERDVALAKAERLRQTVGKLRDALDPDGARSMLSMEAFLDGVPDPVASLRAENDRLRAVIQDNADSARTFLNDVLDAKHIGVVDRGDARDLRGICQVANRPENGGRTNPTCARLHGSGHQGSRAVPVPVSLEARGALMPVFNGQYDEEQLDFIEKNAGLDVNGANLLREVRRLRGLVARSQAEYERGFAAGVESAANEGKFLIPCNDRYDEGVRALRTRIRALLPIKPAEPRVQCQNTDGGRACSSTALPGKPLCWQHGGDMVPDLPTEPPRRSVRDLMAIAINTACGLRDDLRTVEAEAIIDGILGETTTVKPTVCGIDFQPFGLGAASFIRSAKCTLPTGHLGAHQWTAHLDQGGPPTVLDSARREPLVSELSAVAAQARAPHRAGCPTHHGARCTLGCTERKEPQESKVRMFVKRFFRGGPRG